MTRKEHQACEALETVRDINGVYWMKLPISSANPDGVLWGAANTTGNSHAHYKKVLKTRGHKPFRGFICKR